MARLEWQKMSQGIADNSKYQEAQSRQNPVNFLFLFKFLIILITVHFDSPFYCFGIFGERFYEAEIRISDSAPKAVKA